MTRLVRTVTGGVQAADAERAVAATIPDAGRMLFLGVARGAQRCARRHLTVALRTMRGGRTKDQVSDAADWFLLSKLLAELGRDVAAQLARSRFSGTPRVAVDDPLAAFATVGAWLLRETDTIRIAANAPAVPPELPPRTIKRKARTPRKSVRVATAAYIALRTSTPSAAPECLKNDPGQKLRDELRRELDRAKGTAARRFASAVQHGLDARWSISGAFFSALPINAKLTIALAILLRVHDAHAVWNHALDFGIEAMLQIAIRDAGREALSALLASRSSLREEASRNLPSVLTTLYGGDLGQYLILGRSFKELSAMTEAAQAAIAPYLTTAAEQLLTAISIRDGTAFDEECKRIERDTLMHALNSITAPAEAIDVARNFVMLPAHATDGQKAFDAVISSMSSVNARSLWASDAARLRLRAQLEHRAIDTFTLGRWSVAVAIENWTGERTTPAGAATNAVRIATAAELMDWSAGNGAEASTFFAAPGLVFLVAEDVRAYDAQLAFRAAHARFDLLLNGLWFLDDRRHRYELGSNGYVRSATGTLQIVGNRSGRQFPRRLLTAAQMDQIDDLISDIHLRWGSSESWDRIAEGLGHLRTATSANRFYERYAFLWMALETVLANLPIDVHESYTSACPTATRIPYRAALLSGPGPEMKGRTYSYARWARVLELQVLYFLRNKAVHEGKRNPAIDEVLIERFQDIAFTVFANIVGNAFRYDLNTVEDVLAVLEHRYPPVGMVP